MVQVFSKLVPVHASCKSYVHPWTDSCSQATCGLFLHAIGDSLRIYTSVYILGLLMKGKIPSLQDLRKTVNSILQSTAFLSTMSGGFSFFLCLLRRSLGNFNVFSVASLPIFLCCIFAIQLERPNRRTLLALYVSNVATETLWKMLVARNLVKSVRYGQVGIFAVSTAVLLAVAKSGKHTIDNGYEDSIFKILRFVVGPYEDRNCGARINQASSFHRDRPGLNEASTSNGEGSARWRPVRKQSNIIYNLVIQALRVYKRFIYKIKCCDRHHTCPHPFSCLHYVLQGGMKMFSTGLGLQLVLKLVLNLRTIMKSPKKINDIVFRRDNLNTAIFLCGASGLFRATMCFLRRFTGKDETHHALLAGLVAGLAFFKYPDTTIALYVFWKMLHIMYNIGIKEGYLPRVPGFTEFLYCLSTGILFHSAIVEPSTLRPSYWKFLHSISGGRVAVMNRDFLDCWGYDTSRALQAMMARTKTKPVVSWFLVK